VQEIRNALRDGSYPLVPAKIADAMIAAQVSLSLPDRN
jgi:negative regulator of flagellin synthesis FlgM